MSEESRPQIVLIRPPLCIAKSTIALRDGLPSLSLAFLSAAAKGAGYRVRVIDAFIEGHDQVRSDSDGVVNIFGISIDEIVRRIPKGTPVIGLSLMYTHENFLYRELITAISRAHPESAVLIGGEHATFFCADLLSEFPSIKAACIGEGDDTLVDLLGNVLSGFPVLADIAGIAYMRQGQLCTTPRRDRIRDLTRLPLPDWDACGIERYLDNHISLALLGKRVIPVLASRGCPYRCTFCSNERFWGGTWCARPIDQVVSEIEEYIEKYRVEAVDFYDPSLVVNKQWIRDFASELIRRKVRVSWEMPIGTRAESFSRDILRLLKESGLSRLNYAPESGSEKVIRAIKKNLDPVQILRSMREAVLEGLFVRAHLIMGTPDQDYGDVFRDFVFISKSALIGVHDISIFPFVVFPGTEAYEDMKKTGLIDSEAFRRTLKTNSTSNPKGSYTWNRRFSGSMVYRISILLMLYFYFLQYSLRPWRVFGIISNIIRKRSVTSVDRFVYYLLSRKRALRTFVD
ncbi:MAG: hypothetical protein A2X94_07905 [Bdellovibrionales bacterium GWB1_55_8]|nr:MAG: hypothetical protein A2X94_07905 [Bdellovibrionales bacterium GWB1_55_8]